MGELAEETRGHTEGVCPVLRVSKLTAKARDHTLPFPGMERGLGKQKKGSLSPKGEELEDAHRFRLSELSLLSSKQRNLGDRNKAGV